MKVLLAALALLLSAGMAKGDSIWEYSGNTIGDPGVGVLDFTQQKFIPTPNPCGCAIEGSLTLSNAGVPTLWGFTAGAVTLTNLNSTIELDDMAWVGNPNLFAGWMFEIAGQGVFISSSFTGSNFEATDGVTINGQSYQYVQGNHGVWSDPPAATAEPGTLALIGVGLAGLLARKRLQVRRNQVPEAVWEPLA
jgi:PEP-CTERM motif